MNSSTVIETLQREVGLSHKLAVAFVRAKGRCEYCGIDLLMSRQGHASAELDRLLPRGKCESLGLRIDDVDNLVLACRNCNGAKHALDVLGTDDYEPSILQRDGERLVCMARQYIAGKMSQYNEGWRKATEILHAVWWGSERDDA